MKISIKRFSPQNQDLNSFNTFETEEKNLLKSLIFIKENIDNSLTYRCGCKSGVCGSCAVRVNGVEKLACKTIIQDGDIIEPLKNREVVKDLVVNVSPINFRTDYVFTSYDYKLNSITKFIGEKIYNKFEELYNEN